MKNYYNQLTEMRTTAIRILTLEEKREVLEARKTSCTAHSDGTGGGSGNNDKLINLIAEIAEIDAELEIKRKEYKILTDNIKLMEAEFERIRGKKYKTTQELVFIYKYIDGLPEREIARRIPCDISTVYRNIEKIENEIENR